MIITLAWDNQLNLDMLIDSRGFWKVYTKKSKCCHAKYISSKEYIHSYISIK